MRILGESFTEIPRLIFEYVPGGALEDYNDISTGECFQILRQCLSALVYLHEREPPIVHRDIKPGNILVQSRAGGEINVKFGGFGLSKEGTDLITLCGSRRYLAPEIFHEGTRRNARSDKRSYTSAVDIWSLGVAAFECAYKLPAGGGEGVPWCEKVVEKLERDIKQDPDVLKQFLRENMVIMQPESRGSARDCLERVLLLTSPGQRQSQSLVAASYVQQSQQAASQDSTVLLRDGQGPAGTPPSHSPDEPIAAAKTPRSVRSATPSPACKTTSSLISHGGFHKRWMGDPRHPVGGGSTLAAMLATSSAETFGRSESSGFEDPTQESSKLPRQTTAFGALPSTGPTPTHGNDQAGDLRKGSTEAPKSPERLSKKSYEHGAAAHDISDSEARVLEFLRANTHRSP